VSFFAENNLIQSNDRECWLIISRKYLLWVRIDRFLELLRNGEQREIQMIFGWFSDWYTGKGWWTSRTGVPETGGEKVNGRMA
jgi:hypothetical protein